MKITNFIILLCFAFLLYHCKKSPTESETKPLLNTLWTLESLEIDGEVVKPQENQIYNIQFKDDSTFSGRNDCNDIGGSYTFEQSGVMKVSKLGTTFANCGDKSMFREYYNAFEQIFSYEVDKNKLLLRYGEDSALNFISK